MTPCCHHETTSEVMASTNHGTDGAMDRMLRLGQRQKYVPAIFIHAGAGFHSHQNEKVHLRACVAAAEMGMRFLKAGATATEAIEASLRILEDKEITNAGYGSNLSIDGTVECDATIVDYLGRSGACGAVPNIRNPISLAKLILDTSNQPLSLRRVPPNALVGEGAKSFAEEHGMVTLENEFLVSKNARDRFLRWQEDLRRAEARPRDPMMGPFSDQGPACVPCEYNTMLAPEAYPSHPRDHSAAIMAGTWNEGQPDSPYAGTPVQEMSPESDAASASPYFRTPGQSAPTVSRSLVRATPERSSALSPSSVGGRPSPTNYAQFAPGNGTMPQHSAMPPAETTKSYRDALTSQQRARQVGNPQGDPSSRRPAKTSTQSVKRPHSQVDDGEKPGPTSTKQPLRTVGDGKNDSITDTVGAIAIDEKGQIAAGSSSGGIGMKHRGRLGPAALVGIGTAVVPSAEDDEDGITVAAVTSGTGEHMATTMASQRCAERIYHNTRKGKGGVDIQDDDEDNVIDSFIVNDFMNHPGVKNCHSAGAIGVMAVKKTPTGCYFYFAHNTDSFALASMGALEKQPVCTMSRLRQGAKTARGGRKIRVD